MVKNKGDQLFITNEKDKETQESLKKQILDILSEKQASSSGQKN